MKTKNLMSIFVAVLFIQSSAFAKLPKVVAFKNTKSQAQILITTPQNLKLINLEETVNPLIVNLTKYQSLTSLIRQVGLEVGTIAARGLLVGAIIYAGVLKHAQSKDFLQSLPQSRFPTGICNMASFKNMISNLFAEVQKLASNDKLKKNIKKDITLISPASLTTAVMLHDWNNINIRNLKRRLADHSFIPGLTPVLLVNSNQMTNLSVILLEQGYQIDLSYRHQY
jgi:hypothetical protein